ncbi:MAG: amidase [Candidatus Xenobia bacterium]
MLTDLPATELARLIRLKEVSPVEVAGAFLARIEAVKSFNAVLWCDPEWTMEQARKLDPDGFGGALWGVPFTVKDSLDVEGTVTTYGTAGRRGCRSQRDASVVARLRRCGMVVLAKTSVPELCMGLETDNALIGRTLNPHDPERTCGGSSGGEAALLAAGATPLGLGSDTGGSIRLPCHYCGVWGMKPTTGRVARTGHTPGPGGTTDGLWQIGPMARNPGDLQLLLGLIQGPDGHDPEVVPANPERPDPARAQVAWFADNGIVSADAATRAALERAVQRLGLPATEIRPPGVEETAELLQGLFLADEGMALRRLLQKLGTDQPHRLLAEFFQLIAPHRLTSPEYCHLRYRWARLRSRMLEFSQRFPIVLCPVAPGPARLHGTSAWSEAMLGWISFAAFFNLTGWPAMSVPVGRSPEGLPLGVQVATGPWNEELVFEVGRRLTNC